MSVPISVLAPRIKVETFWKAPQPKALPPKCPTNYQRFLVLMESCCSFLRHGIGDTMKFRYCMTRPRGFFRKWNWNRGPGRWPFEIHAFRTLLHPIPTLLQNKQEATPLFEITKFSAVVTLKIWVKTLKIQIKVENILELVTGPFLSP